MRSLNEDELKQLMSTEAYQNSLHPEYEKTQDMVRQGWENLYPDDDRNEHPEKYYVWYSMGDDKVREAHAERHGKVYSWDNPPEGGHPGEDYNCRCYAEEYIPPYRKETNDNYLSEQERREALKQGKKIRLEVKDNPNANGSWPIYHSHTVGQEFVKYYSDKIEKYAEKYNVDVDLVKAIMYTENATGHWLGANYVKDFLGVSKSQAPMNIRGSLWNGIDGKIFDTRNADQNIELGTLVLKKISQAIDSPSVAKIGTLWNATAKDKVSDFGARVEYNYRNRCWEVPERPNI